MWLRRYAMERDEPHKDSASLCGGQLCSPTPYYRKAVTLGRGSNDPDQWSLRDSMSPLIFPGSPTQHGLHEVLIYGL